MTEAAVPGATLTIRRHRKKARNPRGDLSYAGGIVLGAFGGKAKYLIDPKKGEYRVFTGGKIFCDTTESHVVLAGYTGGGKGVGVVLPTMLPDEDLNGGMGYYGSMLVHDRKGELFDTTALHRSKWSYIVAFDPLNPESACWNPFMEVRPDHQLEDTMTYVENLPNDEGNIYGNKETIWDQSSMDYAVGAWMYLSSFAPAEWKCLYGLRRFVALGRAGGEKMMANQHPDKRIREEIAEAARRLWNNDNERFVGSVIATLNSYLRIYSFPAVGRATAKSDFRLSDLQCADKPLTVYQVVRPSYADLLQPLMRMQMVGAQKCLMHDRFVSMDGREKQHELLYLREEFTSEGRVGRMEDIMTDMRGYFQRALIVVQGFGALTKVYGDENHFFNNSIQATLQPRSIKEKKFIETALGEHDVVKKTTSKSRIGTIFSQKPGAHSVSKTEAVRPVMRTAEMARKLKGKVTLLNTEEPYILEQLTAHLDPRYASLMSDEAPDMRDEDGDLVFAPPGASNPWFDIDYSNGNQGEAVTPAPDAQQASEEAENSSGDKPADWPVEMPGDPPLDASDVSDEESDSDEDDGNEGTASTARKRHRKTPILITHEERLRLQENGGGGTWVR